METLFRQLAKVNKVKERGKDRPKGEGRGGREKRRLEERSRKILTGP